MQTAHRIRMIRLRLGVTQAEFAALIGLTQDRVSRLERGEESVTLNIADAIDRLVMA